MLAAQPGPIMGSRRSLSGVGPQPFGYYVEGAPNNDESFLGTGLYDDIMPGPPPPPAPAPGPSMLSSTEANDIVKALNKFLNDDGGPHNFGEGLNHDGWDDVPPLLEGMSSSFGLSMPTYSTPDFLSNIAQATNFSSAGAPSSTPVVSTPMVSGSMGTAVDTGVGPSTGLMAFPPPVNTVPASFSTPIALAPQPSPVSQHHGDRSQYSPDVVEAATVLHGRSHSMHSVPGIQSEHSFSHGLQQRPMNQGKGPPGQHLRFQELKEFQQEGQRMSQSTHAADQQATMNSWIFGANAVHCGTRTTRGSAPIDLQYGTDRSFSNGNQPFEPQLEKETSAAMQEHQMNYLSAIELSRSSNTTPGTDALFNGNGADLGLRTRVPPKTLMIEANGQDGRRSRKSRSGDDDLDEDEEPQSAVSKSSGRKRKSKVESSLDSPAADAGGAGSAKRRKSTSAVKRENLTETQKRENHINSEKKRRKVISTGFENLGHIVPAANGGSSSKSAVLESTVRFLQDLVEGNAQLRQTYL